MMQFNQFVIAPYIGDGSPVTQSLWIDNLRVAPDDPSVIRRRPHLSMP